MRMREGAYCMHNTTPRTFVNMQRLTSRGNAVALALRQPHPHPLAQRRTQHSYVLVYECAFHAAQHVCVYNYIFVSF